MRLVLDCGRVVADLLGVDDSVTYALQVGGVGDRCLNGPCAGPREHLADVGSHLDDSKSLEGCSSLCFWRFFQAGGLSST